MAVTAGVVKTTSPISRRRTRRIRIRWTRSGRPRRLAASGQDTIQAMTRRATLVVAALLVAPLRAAAQPSGQPAAAPSATAYFEFLRGRHLESQGQIAQA